MTKASSLLLLTLALFAAAPSVAQEGVGEGPITMPPDAGMGEGRPLPVGRMPARTQEKAAPAIAPPFRLTPPADPKAPEQGLFRPETFTLPNGMAFVVIPNHRAPIVSHMVWFQVGAADEPAGKAGLAHLLEHLMFKGTPTVPDGQFSHRVAQQGGDDNAFTSWDYTAFYQNIARDRLEMMMELEADRMGNLTLADAQVESEKQVVLAERQQRSENDPLDKLREAMRAIAFVHHPYGRPIIGWSNEIEGLNREDVLAFYRTWYSPANAIVVISGDVTAAEVRPLAERTYGRIPTRAVPRRARLVEPRIAAERQVTLRDAGTLQPVFMRSWQAPSYREGEQGRIAPLQVLAEILGGGPTSRLYRRLVMDLRVATGVRFDYDPVAFDLASASLAVMPAPGQDASVIETALAAVTRDLMTNGVSAAELARAKKRLLDGGIFARDSVEAPAYIFGMTLAAGGDVSDVEDWPRRIMAVTADEVTQAAQALFRQTGSVTGLLLPDADPAGPQAPARDNRPIRGAAPPVPPAFNEREQR